MTGEWLWAVYVSISRTDPISPIFFGSFIYQYQELTLFSDPFLQLARKLAALDWQPYNHTVSHIVKTTLVLPDDLLMEAKTLAARRKTTLKAIIESALRREIRPSADLENPDPSRFEVGPFGILRIRKASGTPATTMAQVSAVQEALEIEELQRITHPQRP
jgi:hypothetical protein